jgi:hypothetical protein
MPICITLINEGNINALYHFIVLQYSNRFNCNYFISFNSSVGYVDNIISNPIHTCITFIKVMQMHCIILLLCNIHAQDNIFHLIWFLNAITRLFWSYAIPYGHIDHIISNPIHTCITFIKLMQYPNDRIQISYRTIFTSTWPLLG